MAVTVLLLATFAHAQNSQFLFDPNGNLTVQMADTIFPPQITGQPQNQTPATNESAAFSVVVADPRALSYQWRFNGANLGGENGNSLLLDNVSTNNEGQYQVVLTNPSGSVTSAPAMLWIDNDGDGLGDSWELTYFGNLNQNATSDFDHDGLSNLREFLDGTDPTDPNSARYRLLVIREGGAVIKNPDQPSYNKGETVMLTATASSNELFHAWLGDIVSRSNPVSVVMTNDKTVHARFTPIVFTWTSPASGDWETATNWTPNLAPGLNDIALITSGVTVTLSTPADCADVTLGSTFTTLTGSGTLTVRGNLFWTAGTMSGSGRTILETNATLNLAGGVTLNTRTLENGGTILWSGGGFLGVIGGAVITNRGGALFRAENVTDASLGGGIAAGRFDNAGDFRKAAGTRPLSINSGLNFNNTGTVEIEADTLLCNGSFNNNGTVTLSPGTTNRLTACGAGGGTFNAPATALVEWTGGTFTLNPGAQLNGAGLYRINLSSVVTANANLAVENLDLINGTLDGSGTVTIATAINWTGGTMSGSGRTIIRAGVALNAALPSLGFLNSRTLENGGTVLWTGAGNIGLNSGAVITNRAGALFHVQSAAFLSSGGTGGRFDNAGTFRKSANSGTTTVVSGVSFNNSGTVEIQTGTLDLGGGGTHSGSFAVPAGTALTLSGGGHSAGASSSVIGAGQFTISGGTATLAGLVNVSGSNTFSGGTANLNGNYICTNNTMTISGGTANFSGAGLVSPAVLNFSNGTLTGTSTVTVNTAMNWTGGRMSGSGRTIIPSGVTVNAAIPSLVILETRTLENGGTVLWTGAGIFGVISGAVITNRVGALFHAQNAVGLGGGIANGRLDNVGTFRKSVSAGITAVASGMSFNNFGVVEIQSGTLDLGGGGTHSGSFTVPVGTALTLSGGAHTADGSSSITGAGQLTVSGGSLSSAGLVNVSGSNTFSGGTSNLTGNTICTNNTVTISGGTANFSGTGLVSPAVLNLSSGTLTGTSTVTVNNTMNWANIGRMSGSGRTIILPGAALNIATASGVILDTRTLENGGTVLWTDVGLIGVISGAVITNRAGALFHVQNAAGIGGGIANGRLDNAGTFRKSVSAGITAVASGMSFNNYGTVDIRSGILAASGGYVSSSSALLNCALGGTTAGTNYGQLQVAGTVTLNGALSVDLLAGFTPATNDTFTVLTAGSRNNTFTSFSYPSNRVTMLLSNSPTSVILRATDVFPIPQPVLLTPQLVGSNALLTWTATSNVTYRLENNAGVGSTNWTAVPGDVTTLSNTASKLDALTPSNRLYRVRVLP
ncbi:MAG: hypothetical protein HY298_15770 [Verrucomicrobia bacterium]|nr:hypothetical protein [Verrucomicrobiota bacterium]